MQSSYMGHPRFSSHEEDPFYSERMPQGFGKSMGWNEEQMMGQNQSPYSQQHRSNYQQPYSGMHSQQEGSPYGGGRRQQFGSYQGFQGGQNLGSQRGQMGLFRGQMEDFEGGLPGMSRNYMGSQLGGSYGGQRSGIHGGFSQRGQLDDYQIGSMGGQRFGGSDMGYQSQPWMSQQGDSLGKLIKKLDKVKQRMNVLTDIVTGQQFQGRQGGGYQEGGDQRRWMDQQMGQKFQKQRYGSNFFPQMDQQNDISELFDMVAQVKRKVNFLTNQMHECQQSGCQDQIGGCNQTRSQGQGQWSRQQPYDIQYGSIGSQGMSSFSQQGNVIGELLNKLKKVTKKVDVLTNTVQQSQQGGFQDQSGSINRFQTSGLHQGQWSRQQPFDIENLYGSTGSQNLQGMGQQSNVIGELFNKLKLVKRKVDILANTVQQGQQGSYQGQMGGQFGSSSQRQMKGLQGGSLDQLRGQQQYGMEDVYGGYGSQMQQTDIVSILTKKLNKVLQRVDILTNNVMGGQGFSGQMDFDMSPYQTGQLGGMSELDFQRQPRKGTFVRSSIHTYKKEGDQEQQVYEVHHSHVTGPHGLLEKKKTIKDTAKKIEKEFHAKYLKGRGYAKETITNTDTNESQESYSYDGLTEDDLDQFEQEWEEAYKAKDQQKQQQGHQHGGQQQWGQQQKEQRRKWDQQKWEKQQQKISEEGEQRQEE